MYVLQQEYLSLKFSHTSPQTQNSYAPIFHWYKLHSTPSLHSIYNANLFLIENVLLCYSVNEWRIPGLFVSSMETPWKLLVSSLCYRSIGYGMAALKHVPEPGSSNLDNLVTLFEKRKRMTWSSPRSELCFETCSILPWFVFCDLVTLSTLSLIFVDNLVSQILCWLFANEMFHIFPSFLPLQNSLTIQMHFLNPSYPLLIIIWFC